jgi:hypothetical protein
MVLTMYIQARRTQLQIQMFEDVFSLKLEPGVRGGSRLAGRQPFHHFRFEVIIAAQPSQVVQGADLVTVRVSNLLSSWCGASNVMGRS